ncbi:ABC transporter substrate-binding protein [Pseudomaricurvus alkylphenolicus]|uniref:MlaC/ttg2D family ABC transporter substrate-binding protein n=1 Tax=Pseudomaricurvus alkylphenolicus TaxID=1306991 RepID=UPI00141E6E0C|nr:ABC transporter substrate-binding protein [Pseudomaricurvus alkylphenolicus]NIB41865.1 ABC transporter substrate-binding protein [Pseudomaricurvus alkylphenolicus]
MNQVTYPRSPLGSFLAIASMAWLIFFGAAAQAQQLAASTSESPYAVVERVTGQVLEVVTEKRHLLDEEPELFYQAVGDVLSPVVAFDYIARGVMGRYAKQASTDQKKRFAQAFQSNLISTYAKGMAVYGNQEVVVVPPDGDIGSRKRVSVVQKVRGEDGENTVAYTMGKSPSSGEWKLLNVVINGVNLGHTFRSQFAQAMKKKVIWIW